MTGLEFLFPRSFEGDVTSATQRMSARRTPFSAETLDFLDALSRDLFSLVRSDGSLAPLAFFIRRANLARLADNARAVASGKGVLVPQGAVLHIPPTNVDTLFLYTLAITLLAGNSNVVRISKNAGPATYRIVELLVRRLEQHPDVAELVTIVSFDRDQAILDGLSVACDMRMIWGGDAAIGAIRSSALAPGAKELTFPDRVSLTAVSVSAWNEASDETRRFLVEGLYNDTFWFDQMACSSPVQVILVGGTPDEAAAVRHELTDALATIASDRYEEVQGQAINKMVDILRAIDRGLDDVEWTSNTVVTIGGAQVVDAVAIRPGGGFYSTQHIAALTDLVGQLTRRIQTLSVFGFDEHSLLEFVTAANGSGIDRIVPIGHALDFAAVWDGKDLLAESLRYVTVDV